MPRISIPKRQPKHHPEVVTGNFQLHYEEVVRKNRYMIAALLGFGIAGLAAIIPIASYRSYAGAPKISVEAEQATPMDANKAVRVSGDPTASGGGYVKFLPDMLRVVEDRDFIPANPKR